MAFLTKSSLVMGSGKVRFFHAALFRTMFESIETGRQGPGWVSLVGEME